MGVIDTLAAGFQTVARRPWPIVLVLVLDLFLWLGPQLSVTPVVDRLAESYHQTLQSETALAEKLSVDPGQLSALDQQTQEVLDQVKGINLFGLLAWQMPSLIHLGPDPRPGLATFGTVTIASVGRLLVAALGLMLVGLVWTSAYNGAIAQYVRGDSFGRSFYFDRLGLNWLRLVGFYLLVAFVGAVVGLPMIVLGGVLNLVLPALGAVATMVFWALAVWILFFLLFFVGEAIFVGDLNPIAAIKSSVLLVQRNFWASVFIIFLVYLISFGMVLAWNYLRENPMLFIVALIGNAFISSGLTAATMIFYRDRVKGGQASRLAAG